MKKKIGTMITVPNEKSDETIRNQFNRAIGVPESADEYPTNELFDDENLRKKIHEIGLTSPQVEKIYSIADEFLSPILTEIFSAQHEQSAMHELKNFFGSIEKMNDALHAINEFGTRFLPHDAFDALCATPDGIRGLYNMMQSMEPNIEIQNSSDKDLTENELRRMMCDPKYWRDNDVEYIRKIENGFKKLYS
ncbi:MAG: hypothetical protein II219_00895 [Alphaproteobacteria bacterium]|nr:hypothetical protein [Alphaproteobacteria bacterium]